MSELNKWDHRFMNLAKNVSKWSKDRSLGVGSVIVNDKKKVLSLGFNGFARGVNDDVEERHSRPMKDYYVIHAEKNAINEAETSLEGSTIYCTFFTCATCAQGIIQNGIKRVVAPEPDWNTERYAETQRHALKMYEESGVEVVYYTENYEASSMIALWESNCGGGTHHGVISKDNLVDFINVFISRAKVNGTDIESYTIDTENKVIEIFVKDSKNRYICYSEIEVDDYKYTR